jgi:hypothetical protein
LGFSQGVPADFISEFEGYLRKEYLVPLDKSIRDLTFSHSIIKTWISTLFYLRRRIEPDKQLDQIILKIEEMTAQLGQAKTKS